MSGPRSCLASTCISAAFMAALVYPSIASAQVAGTGPGPTPDDPNAPQTEVEEGFRFGGRGLYVGVGPGMVPETGDTSFASRIQLVFPVATDWFELEVGLLGQSFSTKDHHGESVDVNVGTITTGARFTFPPDAPIRPYVAPRVAHLHFFPDPYGDHDHAGGHADHETHHRWGAGGGVGFDAGIPDPASRFRIGVDAEAFAITGPQVSVVGQVVALLGIGF